MQLKRQLIAALCLLFFLFLSFVLIWSNVLCLFLFFYCVVVLNYVNRSLSRLDLVQPFPSLPRGGGPSTFSSCLFFSYAKHFRGIVIEFHEHVLTTYQFMLPVSTGLQLQISLILIFNTVKNDVLRCLFFRLAHGTDVWFSQFSFVQCAIYWSIPSDQIHREAV